MALHLMRKPQAGRRTKNLESVGRVDAWFIGFVFPKRAIFETIPKYEAGGSRQREAGTAQLLNSALMPTHEALWPSLPAFSRQEEYILSVAFSSSLFVPGAADKHAGSSA